MKKPWEIRGELTSKRLDLIGWATEAARNECADRAIPSKGDNPWAHGCTAYAWSGTAVEKLSLQHSWLRASMSMNIFKGFIEDVPFTITRDDPAEISERTLSKLSRLPDHECDSSQGDFGFERVWSDGQIRWCIVVDATGQDVFGVSCVGFLPDGHPVARYDVEISGRITPVFDIDPVPNEPHEVQPYKPSFQESKNVDGDNENDFEDGDKDIENADKEKGD